ncbi:NTPase [Halobacillus andaensis]|uniref:inosine/xanthosine triphosphatase n=1 Tax=Halobacillus andaensis TaxID=1176239 RepID=A0A917AYQ5_HALAA|nr:DUF84 family protein [Halobacillus andaensis]MBP2002805.1 inosine/xanthosine triphosphatase [Halobacillus andaensis]GGF05832.1 NTPase [Halobacillus andaensis]
MKIYIGSTNPTKVEAVKRVFSNDDVSSVEVESKVAAQPFSDEETLEGAVNRARECAIMKKSELGIGLEGGVMEIDDDLFLCNWGVLVDQKENVYRASGARIPLPDEIKEGLKTGRELGELMDAYASSANVSKHEGAIGIFTNGVIKREEMFTHVVKLLKGQWERDQQ